MRLLKPAWVHHDDKQIFSVDVHQDCLKFATGGQGNDSGTGRVVIWNLLPVLSEKEENDVNVPKMLCQMDQHLGCVNCVRWSQDGKLLASGSDDKLIMIWRKSQGPSGVFGNGGMKKNPETWKCYYTLRGHAGDVLDLAWSPGDRYLASCSVDNTVIVWEAHAFPRILTVLKGHTGLVKGVSWDPVGKFLASQSDDRSIKIWNTTEWTCSATITEPFEECGGTTHILRLSWSPDGLYLVSAHAMNGGGPTAQIIEREGWKCDNDFVGHRKAVTCVRFLNSILKRQSTEGSGGSPSKMVQCCCLAVGSRDRSLSVWMTALKRPLIVIHELFNDSVLDLSWGLRECLLMACSGDGSIACLQFADNELGTPLSEDDKNAMFQREYGKALGNGILSSASVNSIVEHPDLLGFQQDRVCAPTLGLPPASSFPAPNGSMERRTGVIQTPAHGSPAKAISKQTETRTKDGKRRITPMFIPLHEQTATTLTTALPTESEQVVSVEVPAATPSTVPEPRLSKQDEGRLDSRLKMLPPSQRRHPIPFDPANLENFPRQLNNNPVRTPTDHQGSTIGPKLNITSSSKCEFVKAALDHRIHVQNGHLKTTYGLVAKVSAFTLRERLWETYVGSPVVNVNLCSKYVMLCSLDGSMRLVSMETGCAVFPAISLTTTAVHCAFSPDNSLVGVLTECGMLRIWNIARCCVTLATNCNELLLKYGTAVQFAITDKGKPLIGFPNGNSYSYSQNLQSWLILSNRDAIMFNGVRATLPRDVERVTRDFPLLSMQVNTQNFISLGNALEINTEDWQQSAKIIFIENQIKLCEALESLEELKHWYMMMVFHLASYGQEKRLRIFLDELLHGPETVSMQLIPRDDLMQSVLDTLKPHLRWQRLYVEYVDLFKFCRNERNELLSSRPVSPPSPPIFPVPILTTTTTTSAITTTSPTPSATTTTDAAATTTSTTTTTTAAAATPAVEVDAT
ncbi:protein HIRA homolog [Scaptodrosophila lebanonensis]|uniref:Protein HIRA n=1 Tax=Drosophila lebanonensis TaxID=7225 RepID=A0A6J2TV27_DROLE|nr:protein HIRA homolog [Scaptodrosophila lebanonensis]